MVAGEFTVVIPQRVVENDPGARPSDDAIVTMFGQITDAKGRDAARRVGAATGLSANEVYEIVRKSKL